MAELLDQQLRTQVSTSAFACQTCRHRRVKCDKQKPICARCQKGSRQCDWDVENYINTSRRFIVHSLASAPSSLPDLSSPEKHALHYFRSRASSDLAGPFQSELWGDCLFQLATQQNFLQYALTALSAMHESNLLKADAREQRRNEAVRFHNKAMWYISRCSDSDAPLQAILLAIIVFHSFESLRGCAQQALQHVLSGLKIIQGREPSSPQNIDRSIFDTFVALQNQVREFSDIYLSRAFDTTRGYHPPYIDDFPSWHAAHTQLEIVYNEIYGILDHCYSLRASHIDLRAVSETEIRPRLCLVASRFECWQRGLAKLENESNRNSSACLLLRMYEAFISHVLDSFPASLNFDPCTPGIATVLELAAEFLMAEEQSRDGHRPFSPSLGVIPVLFVLAWRSNCIDIRDQSLQLLRRANRREGVWDSKLASIMAEKAVAIKTHLGAYNPGSEVHAELSEICFDSDTTCLLTYTATSGDPEVLLGERLPPIGAIGDYRIRKRISVAVE